MRRNLLSRDSFEMADDPCEYSQCAPGAAPILSGIQQLPPSVGLILSRHVNPFSFKLDGSGRRNVGGV